MHLALLNPFHPSRRRWVEQIKSDASLALFILFLGRDSFIRYLTRSFLPQVPFYLPNHFLQEFIPMRGERGSLWLSLQLLSATDWLTENIFEWESSSFPFFFQLSAEESCSAHHQISFFLIFPSPQVDVVMKRKKRESVRVELRCRRAQVLCSFCSFPGVP